MVLSQCGNAPVNDLGTLPLAGTVEQADSFEGGENKLYTFTVPTGVLALELRLLNSVGSPKMAVRNDAPWPCILNQYGNVIYGMNANGSATYNSYSLITIANPAPGTYRLRIADPSDPQPAQAAIP